MVTLAPELPGALEVVEALIANGVVVSAGHSNATFEQAAAGFDAGIRFITHLFNAMAPLDHREPGLAGAALADDRVTIGIIPDGLHVHPSMVATVLRTVGSDRLAVVSDAIAALGMPPGTYRLADRDVACDGISARLPGGGLAGSVISLDQAVRNLATFAGIPIEDAKRAATTVPARLLGMDGA
jgi:N-acetylglucosamine-6-phosphate deacetylase